MDIVAKGHKRGVTFIFDGTPEATLTQHEANRLAKLVKKEVDTRSRTKLVSHPVTSEPTKPKNKQIDAVALLSLI